MGVAHCDLPHNLGSLGITSTCWRWASLDRVPRTVRGDSRGLGSRPVSLSGPALVRFPSQEVFLTVSPRRCEGTAGPGENFTMEGASYCTQVQPTTWSGCARTDASRRKAHWRAENDPLTLADRRAGERACAALHCY